MLLIRLRFIFQDKQNPNRMKMSNLGDWIKSNTLSISPRASFFFLLLEKTEKRKMLEQS